MKLITCEFNIDSGCVELRFDDETELAGLQCAAGVCEVGAKQRCPELPVNHNQINTLRSPAGDVIIGRAFCIPKTPR